MALTSNLIEKTSGKAKVSLRVDLLDGMFAGVSFGIMYYNGVMQDGSISLTPYGLEHTNEGEHKDAISKALKKVEDMIASDYNITFNEPPVIEEMEHLIPEESESIDQSEVGSVEEVINP